MDLTVDQNGNIVVHLCGCVGHGPVTLWEMHPRLWRLKHQEEARRALRGFSEKDLERPHREVR